MIDHSIDDGLATIALRHSNPLNPFTRQMTRELTRLAAELEADDAVTAAVIWGGAGRSFSVGGDFEDLRRITTPADFAEYLREIVRSYQALLAFTKPLVAAVDGHAIGQGLQVALMADWRIGSDASSCQMPELKNGVPCPLGSAILESMLGRAAMLHLVVGCQKLGHEAALQRGLLDEVARAGELFAAASSKARTLAAFAAPAFRATKRLHNGRLHALLDSVREPAAQMHAQSFFAGCADAHFNQVLGQVPGQVLGRRG